MCEGWIYFSCLAKIYSFYPRKQNALNEHDVCKGITTATEEPPSRCQSCRFLAGINRKRSLYPLGTRLARAFPVTTLLPYRRRACVAAAAPSEKNV